MLQYILCFVFVNNLNWYAAAVFKVRQSKNVFKSVSLEFTIFSDIVNLAVGMHTLH